MAKQRRVGSRFWAPWRNYQVCGKRSRVNHSYGSFTNIFCEPTPVRDAALLFACNVAIIFLTTAVDRPVSSLFQQYQLLQQSKLLDAAFYLKQNPDVVCAGLNPLLHYLEYGAAEGRAPSADYYQEQCREAGITVTNPRVHYA